MAEIKQMYLNAYYGKHFIEAAMPTAMDIKSNAKPDAIKGAYNKGKKAWVKIEGGINHETWKSNCS